MDKTYLNGVTAIGITLNNEHNIEAMLKSLILNEPSQIIIVDGGSTDKTVEIAKKYITEIYVTEKGIGKQLLYGLDKVKYKYLLSVECDHIYPANFIKEIMLEYKKNDFFGLQATLKCINHNTFFEEGLSLFYSIHQLQKGKKDMIAGPHFFPSQEYIKVLKVQNFNGYSIDTEIGKNLMECGYKVGLGSTIAYQNNNINLFLFLKKYFNYGKGDYDFYNSHKHDWALKRKIQSIFHIFNRYIIDYPIKSFKVGKPHIAIPYLWLSAIVRYSGWVYSIFKNSSVSK